MAYPANFLRLVATGTLFDVERFSYSLSLIGSGTAPAEVPQGVIDAVAAFHQTTDFISNAAKLSTLKLNLLDTQGRYVSQTDTVEYDYPTLVSGGSGQPTAPQIALAITLRTAVRRGLASTGRFYVPAPGGGVGPDGRITTTRQEAAVLAGQTLVNSLNAALPGWTVGVVSDVREGAARPVTSVSVGRVLDTIRSRRASLNESHVDAPVTVGGGGGGGEF